MDRNKKIRRFGGPYEGAGRTHSPFAPRRVDIFSAIKKPAERRPFVSRPPARPLAPRGGGRAALSFRERRPPARREFATEPRTVLPPLADGAVRIIPISGVEEVGRNMTAIEYKNDIIVVDMGFQFRDEDTPGIDYILPNTAYLEERREKIRAVFITHGHLDHIGGISYLMSRIGNPPLYSRQFGALLIKKRQEEFPHVPALNMKIIDGNETIAVSPNIKVETFPISHTIPDSMGLIVKTQVGDIVFIEDVRVDNIKGIPTEEETEQYKRFQNKEVLLLTMDSTSIEKPGFSISEQTVVKNIEEIIRTVKTRLIIATFASQVERIIAIINACKTLNRKVVVEGRSMKVNLEIIKQLKLVDTDSVVIPIEEIKSYPADRIVMIVTGAQGEEFATLMRMANNTHKNIKMEPTDTILLSSSIIPTNYKAVVKLKDNLYRSASRIITYLDSDVHASGHGNKEELAWIHRQIKYRFFIPLHGNHYMLRQHADLAMSLGAPKENIIVPDNGSLIDISADGKTIRTYKEKAPANPIMVDGFAIGGVQEVVLRDRQMLSEDGMFVIIASINGMNGKLRKSPDIISRGFVYLRESQDLLNQTRIIIKKTIEDTAAGMRPINFDYIKDTVTDNVSRFLFQKTAKRPVVIPVLIGV
ncbi:MAG: hypothetical protein A3C08_01830 [Candidatus Taylorbacteria bacterium RIFCSPHIGHO2_02_FULL_47_18]|uniref:Metallo-beta-lactamase domain-containing protein n=1 Tax=Candidatus Taylorbacteria bacterium RIFCSPLOWO2_01_FULL_48_100 TaxID=1802322 RepID=A0A1G2NHC2_9BACT|nr:MAG: hypothetical protein A2670_01980 [Candidatus Taylorbacteria bacterium RIFCSPHIGHO2_01_FULL_48_38]OHA28488.1 MAG: hypothetical protein A3C08_01830 [Candidatus Taylorbacteria bacterium RIFCSPHIGHO2_02_FULL_47_18]OHA34732.1 MAG: hypothetical protein A2938_02350 [Candidatus Taylorbacteria bacterium RIFCSPLOWO2_01_FULL_48_100]OHA40242.1 MAG: hypothetical protein A3J31_01535 [Candidatus Taylorbacteria bacterium RIFCSPLOWO2_02_FULL_48_16]HXK39070.1 ribonuclease J [Candidatus Paceibacterota bac